MGYRLRRRVAAVLKTFERVLMISLTVDRTLFPNAQAAYEWVRRKHGIGLLVKNLRRKGWVESGRYIWFLEFQKAGWPHWHVFVDAKYIPAGLVYEVWGKLRPPGIDQVDGRPPFGKVDVSPGSKFQDSEHAANYGTKYVIKEPREGWPEWVWEFEGRVARYGVSRGFWGDTAQRRAVVATEVVAVPHGEDCFCEECRAGRDVATGKERRTMRTIRERVARCGEGSVLFRRDWVQRDDGKWESRGRRYLGYSRESLDRLCSVAGVSVGPGGEAVLQVGHVMRVWIEFTRESEAAIDPECIEATKTWFGLGVPVGDRQRSLFYRGGGG